MAALLRYVKTLDYHDKPNYQHIKQLLASDVTGRLDFSMPQGASGESTTKGQDLPAREKVRTWRGQGPVEGCNKGIFYHPASELRLHSQHHPSISNLKYSVFIWITVGLYLLRAVPHGSGTYFKGSGATSGTRCGASGGITSIV